MIETCSRRSLSFQTFKAKHNTENLLSLNTTTVLNNPKGRTRNMFKNTNTLKCYLSDEPARGF